LTLATGAGGGTVVVRPENEEATAMAEGEGDRGSLSTQLDELGDQLIELRAKVEEQAEEARVRLDPFLDQARSDWEMARRAAERTGSAARDAVRAASKEAESDVIDLRADLATVRADLRTEMADSRETYFAALHDLVDSWRARIDELRVQADLARMEARDEGRSDVERAEHQWDELKVKADHLSDQAAEATADLRADVRRLVDDLRQTIRKVADRLTAEFAAGDADGG
jgi:gas vesicle protein